MDIQKIDKNFLTRMPSGIDLRFYDADEVPFEVYGLLPHQQDEPYRRIHHGRPDTLSHELENCGHIGRMAKPYQDEPYAVIRKQWV